MTESRPANGNQTSGYDLAVVGAGSAGFSAAITAAERGATVALVGQGTIGGTCVNIGCLAAEALHGARAAGRFPGLAGEARVVDRHRLIAAKDDLVAGLRQQKYSDLLSEYAGITYLEAPARLLGAGVQVNGSTLHADSVVITTGVAGAA